MPSSPTPEQGESVPDAPAGSGQAASDTGQAFLYPDPDPATVELPPRKRRRRVTTQPPEGSDPTPATEPPRHARGENDDRMRGDKPPHY